MCSDQTSTYERFNAKRNQSRVDNVHSTSAPAFVYNWVNEFERGRTFTCDASRSGRPIETAMPEIIDKIHDIVLTDRRVKVRKLVEATGISHDTDFNFARTIGYEKAIGKMGAAFAHCGP